MVNTNFERGEVLKIKIPSDWKPTKSAANRCKIIQKKGISYILILEKKENEIYLAIPCDLRPTGNVIPINISGNSYYAHIEYLQIDAAILCHEENAYLTNKENTLNQIEAKFRERAERRRQARERKKERKKSEPTIQEILYNWPTKAIADERRNKEHLLQGSGRKEQLLKKSDQIHERIEKKANHSDRLPKYIKGYECVSLMGLNRNAFKHKITLTNYICDECLECSNNLVKFVNFIQISETQGIKLHGRYCTKCDSFYEDRGLTLKNLLDEEIAFDNYTLKTDYLIPDYSQKLKVSRSLKSAAFAIHLNCQEHQENRLITIVTERSDRNHEHDVFHYSDWFARRLLHHIFRDCSAIQIEDKTFDILKLLRLDWKNVSLLNQLKIDTIVLRAGGGLYGGIHQRGTELVDILLYSPFTDCLEVTHATYDREAEIYYMDVKVFRYFIEKYGNPGVKIAAYQSGARDFSTMQEESILHAYGYVVGITKGLSQRMRQVLLGEVMDLGIMSAESIIRLLDHNISMHPNDKYIYARMDWEADKQFVMEYKVTPERFVVSTIGL